MKVKINLVIKQKTIYKAQSEAETGHKKDRSQQGALDVQELKYSAGVTVV